MCRTQNSTKLLLHGAFLDVQTVREEGEYRISQGENSIRVQLPRSVQNESFVFEYLRKWLRNMLLDLLSGYLKVYTQKMGVYINKVYVKNQRTRWASCSSNHNLNFNLMLIALPKHLIEYIVVHELAHLKLRDHTKKFWRLVKEYCPQYKERKKELKTYSLMVEENGVWQRMLNENARSSMLHS